MAAPFPFAAGAIPARGFAAIAACWLLLVACPMHAQDAGKIPRIGFLGMDSQMQAERVAAFNEGLRALGYVDGRNVVVVYEWAEGRFDQLPELATNLVKQKVDIIVTAGPPAVDAARRATRTIPIVVAAVHNPIGQGYVATLAHPGGNITGLAFQDEDLSEKRLELLRSAVPRLSHLAVLWNSAEGAQDKSLQQVEAAAHAMNIAVLPVEIRTPGDIAPAIARAKQWGADGLLQMASPFFTKHRVILIGELRRQRLPATCEARMYVVDGCLMSYGPSLEVMYRQSASYVDRILKGANPAELAMAQPRDFDLYVNGKTAGALGLTIPRSLEYQMAEPLL